MRFKESLERVRGNDRMVRSVRLELLERRDHSRAVGPELNRLAEIADGAVAIAIGAPGDAAGIVGVGIVRIQPDHVGEVGDGAVVLAEADRAGEVGDGASKVALRPPSLAAAHTGDGTVSLALATVLDDEGAAGNIAFRIVRF